MLQVKVENFQSIESASLTVKGFTLIVGQSNQGKSATLRALKAACTNRFKAGQVRSGQDHALIKIKTPESPKVLQCLRPWNGSIKYKLGDELFSKVGRTMPKQINEFLNLGTLDAGSESYSLNFHDQFQAPLLLAFSQAKVMELLSVSSALQDLKDTKDALMIKRQENKGALASIQAIKDEAVGKVHELESQIEQLEPIVTEYVAVQDDLDSIDAMLSNISSLESTVTLITGITNKLEVLEELILACDNLLVTESVIDLASTASGYVDTIDRLNTKEQLLTSIVETYDEELDLKDTSLVDLQSYVETLNALGPKISKEESRLSLYQEMGSLTEIDDRATHSTILALESTLSQLGTVQSRIDELEKITEAHVCPFCGSHVE